MTIPDDERTAPHEPATEPEPEPTEQALQHEVPTATGLDERDSIEPAGENSASDGELDAEPQPASKPRWTPPRWLIGAAAMLFAVFTVVAHAAGVATASAGDAETGTTFAYLAIGASIPGFALGVLAIVLDRGRGWGIVAIFLSIFGNPFLLVQLLGFFGG